MELVRYTSIKDSGTDSALALFQDEQEYILVTAGPGFSPDGANRRHWAWGSCMVVENPDTIPANLEDMPEALVMSAGNPIGAFPDEAWHDNDGAVKELLRYICEEHEPVDPSEVAP